MGETIPVSEFKFINDRVAAAEHAAYLRALDAAMLILRKNYPNDFDVMNGYKEIDQLKADYMKGKTE